MTDFGSSQTQKTQLPESSKATTPAASNNKTAHRKIYAEQASSLSTVGQLMRSVAQSVQHLYRDRLGHTPSRVTCDLINDKLLIWAENSISRPEQMLAMQDCAQLTAVSMALREGLRAALIEIVERTLNVEVITLLSDICYEQNCTAVVVLLASPPRVRASRTRY